MRREQTGGCCRSTGSGSVALRHSWREIFCGKLGIGRKKEKRSKKERNGSLWKLTPMMEIRSQRGFPQRLGKHKPLSTVPTRHDGGSITGFTFPWAEGWGTPQTLNSKCANSKLSQQRGSPQQGVAIVEPAILQRQR